MIKIKLPKEFKISNNYYKNTDLPNNNKQLRKYFKKIELEKIIYPESQKKLI